MPYWRAKWQMEQDVAASGLEHVIFRPSFVFGKDGGVLPTFVRQVRYSPVVTVLGPGTAAARSRSGSTTSRRTSRARSTSPDAANRTFELGGPGHRELERALPPHRRACSASAALFVNVPFAVARTGARLTRVGSPARR